VSIATLHADINKVTDGVFSADGRRVITSSDDGVIQIYRCDVCVSSRALLKLASSRTP
jgi:WD40 repeat protein